MSIIRRRKGQSATIIKEIIDQNDSRPSVTLDNSACKSQLFYYHPEDWSQEATSVWTRADDVFRYEYSEYSYYENSELDYTNNVIVDVCEIGALRGWIARIECNSFDNKLLTKTYRKHIFSFICDENIGRIKIYLLPHIAKKLIRKISNKLAVESISINTNLQYLDWLSEITKIAEKRDNADLPSDDDDDNFWQYLYNQWKNGVSPVVAGQDSDCFGNMDYKKIISNPSKSLKRTIEKLKTIYPDWSKYYLLGYASFLVGESHQIADDLKGQYIQGWYDAENLHV